MLGFHKNVCYTKCIEQHRSVLQTNHDLIHIHICLSNMIIIGVHLSFPFNQCTKTDEFILVEWIAI